MEFATAPEKGFAAVYFNVEPDGAVMVRVGSSVERVEESLASYENLEGAVRIENAANLTCAEIQRAALKRAAEIFKAAADALTAQTAS
jgi:hypothetical protein